MVVRSAFRHSLAACWVSLFLVPATADTLVIDDGGGPGVEFTQISHALAVAQPGDLLLVGPGLYQPFATGRGVRILAQQGAFVTGTTRILGVPADQRFHMSRLQFHELEVNSCYGTVLLEQLWGASSVAITYCADVRLRGGSFGGILSDAQVVWIDTVAFLELADVSVLGANGSGSGPDGGDGVHAVLMRNSNGLFARSTFDGGDGEDAGFDFEPGIGGHGIYAFDKSSLRMTGKPYPPPPNEDHSNGGDPGYALNFGYEEAGDGLRVTDGFARVSGMTFAGGFPGGVGIRVTSSTLEQPAIPDPDLMLLSVSTGSTHGNSHANGTARLRVRGQPGANVRIALGRRAIVEPHPTLPVPRLVEIEQYLPVGQIGPAGTFDYEFKLMAGLARGDAVVAQADIVPVGGGTTQRTNSIHFMVR